MSTSRPLPLRKPKALPRGGRIALAAPAGPVDPDLLDGGRRWIEAAGYRPVVRRALLARRGYLAGDDERRAKELADFVDDPDVDAIWCARGGYGCHRIVGFLDPAAFRAAAKPLVGFSDVTTLLLWQWQCAGLVGFHGPMLARAPQHPDDLARVLAVLGGEPPGVLEGRGLGGGRRRGALVGGGLALVSASLGCPWEPDLDGAILLIEDVNEAPYRLDRALAQLHAAGKLSALAGFAVGSLEGCEDPRDEIPAAVEVVAEYARPLGVPLVVDLPFGHGERHRIWPVGVEAEIDGERGEVRILEPAVQEDPD